jgi:hypothetical protein
MPTEVAVNGAKERGMLCILLVFCKVILRVRGMRGKYAIKPVCFKELDCCFFAPLVLVSFPNNSCVQKQHCSCFTLVFFLKMKFFVAFLAVVLAFAAISGVSAQECDVGEYQDCVNNYVNCFTNNINNNDVCDCLADYINCLADDGCICTTDGGVNDVVEAYLETVCTALAATDLCDSNFESECRSSFSDICNDGGNDSGSNSVNIPDVFFSYVRFVVAEATTDFNANDFRDALAAYLNIPVVRVLIRNFFPIFADVKAARQSETGVDVAIQAESQGDANNLRDNAISGANSNPTAITGFIVDNASADSASTLGVATAVLFSAAAMAMLM